MTSYCDVVSQEVSSVSGVTDMPSSSAEYSSVLRRDASEVDDAAVRLRLRAAYFSICARDDHITGSPVRTPFFTVHCF